MQACDDILFVKISVDTDENFDDRELNKSSTTAVSSVGVSSEPYGRTSQLHSATRIGKQIKGGIYRFSLQAPVCSDLLLGFRHFDQCSKEGEISKVYFKFAYRCDVLDVKEVI
jgi:hypothetical protein